MVKNIYCECGGILVLLPEVVKVKFSEKGIEILEPTKTNLFCSECSSLEIRRACKAKLRAEFLKRKAIKDKGAQTLLQKLEDDFFVISIGR
jgi:hypothetical protein